MIDLTQSFGPICEGISTGYDGPVGEAADIYYPEVIAVRQGNKVWFAKGERGLTESIDESCTLVENFDDLDLDERVVQGKTIKHVKDGKWIVEGPFQRSDVRNKNGRIYKRAIWERIVGNSKSPTMEDLRAGGMLGHLEHPADGRMDGNKGALVVRDLKLRKDGVVWGIAELLDTDEGLRLQEYTRKKVRWGVSSRGNGSVDADGNVNESDYALVTFDGVMRPSTPGAYPTLVKWNHESEDTGDDEPDTGLSEDVKQCISEVESVQAVDVSTLSESDQHRLAARLLTDLNKVDSLRGSQTLSPDKATELQDWLTKKLKSVHESLAEVAETRIDRAIEDAAATLDDEDDAQVVITALQQQVTDAAEATESVRQELETTRERLTEVEGQVAILESERDTAQERVSELEAELEQAQEGLSIAEATIAGLTTADVADEDESDEVTEAVDAAIAQNPDLTPYRARLMECVTPDEVLAEVEHLRPAPPPEDPEPPVAQRRTLPPRGVVVESESRAGTTRPNTVGSTGARMAGKALGKMKASTR